MRYFTLSLLASLCLLIPRGEAQPRSVPQGKSRPARPAARKVKPQAPRPAVRPAPVPASSKNKTKLKQVVAQKQSTKSPPKKLAKNPAKKPAKRSLNPPALIVMSRGINPLREQLDSIIKDRALRSTRIGVEARSLRTGEVLYAYNENRLFNPASNTKILSTAAALALLGKDFRYSTTLHGPEPDEEGVIKGDVDLRGTGDPSLTTTDLAELAHALAGRGVTRIEGDVLADSRACEPAHPEHRLPAAVGIGSGLILNRNSYVIRVSPTEPGRPAVVNVLPAADYFSLRANVKTVPKRRSRLSVSVSREAGRLIVTVSGRIRPGREVRIKQRIGDAALSAAATLRQALGDFGIEVTGTARSGAAPPQAPILARHWSQPLSEICRVSNKDSNNFVAEAIFRLAGGGLLGYPGSLAKGQQAVTQALKPYGLLPGTYRMVNGSGLTHENRIAPAALANLLRRLYFDLFLSPEFVASLAVGGIDGTIRGRFHGDTVGLVRAKTGTLTGVSTLSGYVGQSGDVIVFSIMMEGFSNKKVPIMRGAQVRMVTTMMRYLQSLAPAKPAATPMPDNVTPAETEEEETDDTDAPADDNGAPAGEE